MGYEDKKPFRNFFDLKAYMIMACMMGGGIGFRAAGIFPDVFIAFFLFWSWLCIGIGRRCFYNQFYTIRRAYGKGSFITRNSDSLRILVWQHGRAYDIA